MSPLRQCLFQHIEAEAAVARGEAETGSGNEIDRKMIFVKSDAGAAAAGFQQAGGYFFSSSITVVQDAAAGVASFAAKIDFRHPIFQMSIKLDAPGDQFFDTLRPLADDGAHDLFIAESRPGVEGIGNVQVDGIVRSHHRSDASLGPRGIGSFRPTLG